MTTGGKSYDYLTDATGNVLGLVDNTGKRTHTYAYGPTGLPRTTPTESVPQPYRYAGTYLAPTGLCKMGHRYYDPTLGRFTQPDPSGQETNPYLYAAGDPVNRIDPSGLDTDFGDFLGNVANGAGAGAGIGTTVGAGLGLLGGPLAPITVAGGAGTGAIVGTVTGTVVGVGVGTYDLTQ